jgi:hypothetical protein
VFTILKGNSSGYPPIPPRPVPTQPPQSAVLGHLDTLEWIPNKFPFMMLLPKYKPFYYPLFDRLDIEEHNVPIYSPRPGAWCLDPRLVTEWVTLERNLRAVAYAMLDVYRGSLPRFFEFWPFPKRYGYELQYSCRLHVKIIAIRSRNAFVPLMAAVSLMFLLLRDQESILNGFQWRDKVIGKTNIHPQWLTALEDSAAGDLSVERIGGIVSEQDCEFKGILRLFCQVPLDLYICWGAITDRPERTHPFLTPLVPSRSEISMLRSSVAVQRRLMTSRGSPSAGCHLLPLTSGAPLSGQSTSPQNSLASNSGFSSQPPATNSFPPVERYSGQKAGEHWCSFFDRRQEWNDLKAAKETPEQQKSRLQRLENAAKGNVPGKRGARIYIWEDTNGFRVRRAAHRNDYESVWDDYSSNQRRYDPFRDEWDLCSEFGDSDVPVHDDGIEASDVDDSDIAPPSILLPEDSIPADHNEGEYSSAADLTRVYDWQGSCSYENYQFLDTIEERAYFRFGFDKIGEVAAPTKSIKWSMVREILGNGRWLDFLPVTIANPQAGVQNTLCSFFGYMSASNTVSDMCPELYDLCHPDEHLQRIFANVRVRCAVLGETLYYLIRPKAYEKVEETAYELGLISAAATVEILRHEWGPDLVSIAWQLLHRGIAFNTFIHANAGQPARLIIPRYSGLGYRPVNYQPTIHDYQSYECKRNHFLRSPRGRAALLAGGLIARLARDVVNFDDVCYGPSDEFYRDGFCLKDEKYLSFALWDDYLTEDEQDMICGVYKVDTGKSSTLT